MGETFSKYVIPGAETAVGVGSEIVAPGNPIGIGLAGSGIGQLAGGAAGGSKGQAMGGGLGSLLGGLGGGMMGGGGGMPGTIPIGQMNGLSPEALSSALSSNPSLKGITPDMVIGASPQAGGLTGGAQGPGSNFAGMLAKQALGMLGSSGGGQKPQSPPPPMPQPHPAPQMPGPSPLAQPPQPVRPPTPPSGMGGPLAGGNSPTLQLLRSMGLA